MSSSLEIGFSIGDLKSGKLEYWNLGVSGMELHSSLVVAHRRSLLRCAPEQLLHASNEEKAVAEFPESELLGIKNLLERGQFPRSQFTDIVGQEAPPQPDAPEQVLRPVLPDDVPRAQSAAEMFQQKQSLSTVDQEGLPMVDPTCG